MKTYANFAALLAAINSGEVNPANIEVYLDNDSVSFISCVTERGLLESDESPEEMLKGLLNTLGFASVEDI